MSRQDDAMIGQEQADALEYMGEAEWREMFNKTYDQPKEAQDGDTS